ncbi:peroxiredoxin [Sediminihabitans luteus]|uniref:Alkyl hydroperoxide reductase E n=1 Tax=Sediminihabitans luteus TaxID=1138585 RepID=A0A2M9CQ70_9CELL|nr:peroxiredoxin [Sediminihabitans luteus]PJJ73985.1 peroxiredoxin [Sediminihabitans luteus]GII98102.1 peroxiredoxin [Sediminihabitans luteus]
MGADAPDEPLTVGDPAPDLTLPDTHGTPVRLADVEGPVMVVFFPFAFSGICTGELCELRDNLEDFEAAGVTLLGVSCDPVFSLRAWAEQQGFDFELLSDFWPHGDAARSFGVFDATRGRAGRGSFLLSDGVVRWSVVTEPGVARDLDGYREALATL